MHDRFIAPENLPVQYGGLEQEAGVSSEDHGKVVHRELRPGTLECIQIPVPQVFHY